VDSTCDVYYCTHIYGYPVGGAQLFAITAANCPAQSARGDLLIGSANGYLCAIGRGGPTAPVSPDLSWPISLGLS
jgi:hypothetical protein